MKLLIITYKTKKLSQRQDDDITTLVGVPPTGSGCFIGRTLQRDLEYTVSGEDLVNILPRLIENDIEHRVEDLGD